MADDTPQKKPPKRPDQRVLKDLPITGFTGEWGSEAIEKALIAHKLGQFLLSAQLAEDCEADDRVAIALETRAAGLMGLPLQLEPGRLAAPDADADPDAVLAREMADQLALEWEAEDWTAALLQALRWMIMVGFGLLEVIWKGDADHWTFELKCWHPQFVWFNWATRRFVVNTQEGPVEIEPGDGKWFLLTAEGPYRAWMRGAIRSLAAIWLVRQDAIRDQARFNEVYGLAIRKAIVPAGTDDGDKDHFFNDVANLGSETVVMCARDENDNGYDIELVEATATGWQTFDNTKTDSDKRITIRLVGQNLTTDVEGGSRAAATVHQQVKGEFLKADERAVMRGFFRQVLRLWAAFNYGRADLAPKPSLPVTPPEDRKVEAEQLDVVADAAAKLSQLQVPGARVDTRALLVRHKVPLVDVDDAGDPSPAPAPAPSEASGLASLRARFPRALALLEQLERDAAA